LPAILYNVPNSRIINVNNRFYYFSIEINYDIWKRDTEVMVEEWQKIWP
jgi:hypothetical protein